MGEIVGFGLAIAFWTIFGPLIVIGGLGLVVFVWRAIVGPRGGDDE